MLSSPVFYLVIRHIRLSYADERSWVEPCRATQISTHTEGLTMAYVERRERKKGTRYRGFIDHLERDDLGQLPQMARSEPASRHPDRVFDALTTTAGLASWWAPFPCSAAEGGVETSRQLRPRPAAGASGRGGQASLDGELERRLLRVPAGMGRHHRHLHAQPVRHRRMRPAVPPRWPAPPAGLPSAAPAGTGSYAACTTTSSPAPAARSTGRARAVPDMATRTRRAAA